MLILYLSCSPSQFAIPPVSSLIGKRNIKRVSRCPDLPQPCIALILLVRSPEFVKLLYNAAWYLYEVSDYDICLKLVETAWLACDDKDSLQYAELCNVAGCVYHETNKLGECRRHWLTFSKIQEASLPENHIDVSQMHRLYSSSLA